MDPELIAYLDRQFGEVAARFEQVDRRFEQVDQRSEQVDQRFEQVAARFEQVDQRFERVDQRFAQVDRRFDETAAQVDRRFEQVDRRFEEAADRVDRRFAQVDDSLREIHVLLEGMNVTMQTVAEGVLANSEAIRAFRSDIERQIDEVKADHRLSYAELDRRLRDHERRISKLEAR